jgi:hypothetical protein
MGISLGPESVVCFPPVHASIKLAVSATEVGAKTEQRFQNPLEKALQHQLGPVAQPDRAAVS